MFTKDFILFFIDLSLNNTRDWFHANKKRYETFVKHPFEMFVKLLITEIKRVEPDFNLETKDAIFRIHRDVRFAQDKSPYKLNVSAVVAPDGRKSMSDTRGFYIEISSESIDIYGGAYMPDKVLLENIRTAICKNLVAFKKIINEPVFVETFGTIQGEKNRRLSKPFSEYAEQEPLLLNKQFYIVHKLDIENLFVDDLVEQVIDIYKVMRPFTTFLNNATK